MAPPRRKPARDASSDDDFGPLRIVGGELRGRKLRWNADARTRPMKDRTREAVFNLLGPAIRGKQALDLFAGTGAVGIEALSRGAVRALFVERLVPAAKQIEAACREFQVEARATVVPGDVFARGARLAAETPSEPPWAVFVCPPYALYEQEREALTGLLKTLAVAAPAESLFLVEAPEGDALDLLPPEVEWRNRLYRPALIAWGQKG